MKPPLPPLIVPPTQTHSNHDHNLAHQPPPSYPDHIYSPRPSDSDSDFHDLTAAPGHSNPSGSHGELHPYLGLRARLCLSVLSPPLVALLFTGTHLLLSSGDIDDKIGSAKASLLNVCYDAEHQASMAASLPHFMADAMNARTQEAVEGSVRALGRVVYLTLVALEALVTFFVNSYRSVFLCFIELLVRGSLSLLMAAVELMHSTIHETGVGIKSAVQASIDGVNGFLNTSLDGINDLLSIVGKSVQVPQISQPDLSALDNVHLPTSFEDALLKLNGTLPTLTEFKQRMDSIVQMPFEKLKVDVNATTSNFTFDTSLLPLPDRQSITFCEDLDMSPLDGLGNALKTLVLIGIITIGAVILLLLVVSIMQEWWAWRCLVRNVANTRRTWLQSGAGTEHILSKHNLMDLLSMSHHPLLTGWALKTASICGVSSPRGERRVRWWASFIGHPTALICLAIGLCGMLRVEVQLLAIRPIERHYQRQLDGSFEAFGNTALTRINAVTANASYAYANRTNGMISSAQDDLNEHLFGWVNTTTGTMNNTLNELVDGLSSALNETFANTPLFTPLQTFITCLLLQKVINIEKALTWLQDNAHADFPLVSPTVLMLSANRSQELVQPIQEAANGQPQQGGGSRGGVLAKVIDGYEKKLKKERLLFALFLALYGIVLLVGTAVALLHPAGQRRQAPNISYTLDKDENEPSGDISIQQGASLPPSPCYPHSSVDATRRHNDPNFLGDTRLETSTTPMTTFARLHGTWQEEQRRRFEEQQERERDEQDAAWEAHLQSPVIGVEDGQSANGPPRRSLMLARLVSRQGDTHRQV